MSDEIEQLKKERDQLQVSCQVLRESIRKYGDALDGLLNHCKLNECEECSKIVCPFGDPLHLHHDGCPSCSNIEEWNKTYQAVLGDGPNLSDWVKRSIADELAELVSCLECKCETASPGGYTCPRCKTLTTYQKSKEGK